MLLKIENTINRVREIVNRINIEEIGSQNYWHRNFGIGSVTQEKKCLLVNTGISPLSVLETEAS